MSTDTISPLRQRMIEDMNARKLCAATRQVTSAVASVSQRFSTGLPTRPHLRISSEGPNSLAPMAVAIGALRERVGPNRAISVVHTDLPGNDFSALFETLADDPDSYLRSDPAVFASAVGRSYYQQILPSDSVTLGWTSWALHWLSRTPAPIPDHVLVAFSRDATARAAYTRQATEDWRNFFLSRAGELRAGGRLVVLTMALTDDGGFAFPQLVEALYGALNGRRPRRYRSPHLSRE
jgi:hypothetical protein